MIIKPGQTMINLKTTSLAIRLFGTAIILSLLVLPVTALVLLSNYQKGVEEVFDQRLSDNLLQLVDRLDKKNIGPDTATNVLPDPRFNIPLSGWYWQVTPRKPECNQLYKSESLINEKLVLPSQRGITADINRIRRANMDGPDNQKLRILERIITTSQKQDNCREVSVAIAGDASDIADSIRAFKRNLFLSLGILGIGMVLATLAQVHYGLSPLRKIHSELGAIRSGDLDRLAGDVPDEIQPLKKEINALITSNFDIIERARMHVGNLAHALKTPLSVITNESATEESEFAKKVAEQAEIMKGQINHHLDRARMVARVGVIGSVVDVSKVSDPLIRVISRIYEEKNLTITASCDTHLRFQGERQDLEEMMGNLVDNACKWAKEDVRLEVTLFEKKTDSQESAPSEDVHKMLRIVVLDDGPGLPEENLETVIKRGKRLDESKPGSGLGLSIVDELAELYQGKFYLENRTEGGLKAILELPAA